MLNNIVKTKNRNILIATIAHFTIDLYPAFIVGLIPLLAAKFSLSIFQVSILTAVSQISNSITQPFFGILSDRHGVKKYMTFGLLTAALFISLIAILPNYFLILLFLFIGNLGVSAFHPPSAAMGAQYVGRKKGFGNSIISLGGNAGYAMGSIFFIAIIEKMGIKFSPLAMIPGLLITLFLVKKLKFSDTDKVISQDSLKLKSILKIRKAKLASIFLVWYAAFSRDVLWIALLTFLPLYFTKNKHECTGCRACETICPQNSITLEEDSEGFLYPTANDSCINCGMCYKVCPTYSKRYSNLSDFPKFAVAAKHKNENTWFNSTSGGGVFSYM